MCIRDRPGEAQPEADPAPSPAFRLPLRNVTNANILNYLTQERKLSPSLVNFFIAVSYTHLMQLICSAVQVVVLKA